MSPRESRLAALIADTALEEVNPYRAMDFVVFIDSERLSSVGRRMRAAGQEATFARPPLTPRRVTASPPSWHNMPSGHTSRSSPLTSPWVLPSSPSLAGREMPSRPLTHRDSGSRFTT